MHRFIFQIACISAMLPALGNTTVVAKRNESTKHKILVTVCFAALVVLAGLFVGTGVKNALSPEGSHDFQWTPARSVVDGIDPYREFINWQSLGNESVPPHFLNQSPSYPASTYILLSPFAHFEWQAAKMLWLVTNLACIGLLLYGLQKVFPIQKPALLALLVLSFLIASPLRTSLGAGQHNLISLAAFIWAYYFAHNGKNKSLSGLLLAVAWIKYSLTFPLTLIFLRRGTCKPVLIAAAVHAIFTCIAAWRINLWPHEFFFNSVKVVLMGDGTGFLNLIALCMNLDLALPVPLTLIGLATLAIVYTLYRRPDSDPLVTVTYLGLISCAVFYHHGYDFVVLIFCAWALAQGKLQGLCRYTTLGLLTTAWAGQWLVHELTPVFGHVPALCVDYLLISIFYCCVFVYTRELYRTKHSYKRATAVAF